MVVTEREGDPIRIKRRLYAAPDRDFSSAEALRRNISRLVKAQQPSLYVLSSSWRPKLSFRKLPSAQSTMKRAKVVQTAEKKCEQVRWLCSASTRLPYSFSDLGHLSLAIPRLACCLPRVRESERQEAFGRLISGAAIFCPCRLLISRHTNSRSGVSISLPFAPTTTLSLHSVPHSSSFHCVSVHCLPLQSASLLLACSSSSALPCLAPLLCPTRLTCPTLAVRSFFPARVRFVSLCMLWLSPLLCPLSLLLRAVVVAAWPPFALAPPLPLGSTCTLVAASLAALETSFHPFPFPCSTLFSFFFFLFSFSFFLARCDQVHPHRTLSVVSSCPSSRPSTAVVLTTCILPQYYH